MKTLNLTLSLSLKSLLLTVTLLLTCATSAWGATSSTFYFAINPSTIGNNCNNVKFCIKYGGGDNEWSGDLSMTKQDNTFNGKLVYQVTYSFEWGGYYNWQFMNGTDLYREIYAGSWNTTLHNGQVYDYDNNSWTTYSADASYTVYYVNNNDWEPVDAYAYNSECDRNADWPGSEMLSTGKTYNGHTIYSITFNKRYATIIFDCSSSSCQTEDLTLGTTNAGKMYDGTNWIDYKYDVTVTFNANGHGTAPSAQHIYNGQAVTEPTAPVQEGYTFGGWYEISSCTGSAWNFSTALSADKILYAKWTAWPVLSFANDGYGTATYTWRNPANWLAWTISATPNDGYEFDYWEVTSGTITWPDNDYQLYKSSNPVTINISANATVKAHFKEQTNGTVTLVAGTGGQVSKTSGSGWASSVSYENINSAQTLNIYAKANTGYRFVNWTKTGDGSIGTNAANGTYNATARGIATVTANFEIINYSASVSTADGQSGWGIVVPTSATLNSVNWTDITATAHETKGYYFDHWEVSGVTVKDNDLTNRIIQVKASANGGTLVAHFRGENRPTNVYLTGTMNSWVTSGDDWRFVKLPGEEGNTVSLTKTINKNDYSSASYKIGFNIYHSDWDNKWWRNSTAGAKMDAHNCTNWNMNTQANSNSTYLDLNVSGEYTFTLTNSDNSSTQALTVTYPDKSFIEGNFATAWNEDAYTLTENGNIQSVTIPITSLNNVQFRLVSHGKLFGNSTTVGTTGATITKESNSVTLSEKNMEDAGAIMTIGAYVAGNYTFSYNKSTKVLTVTWPVVNQLQIYTADPAHAAVVANWDWDSHSGSIYTKTLSLNANTKYKFKVVYNSDFYGFKTGSPLSGDNNSSNPMTAYDNTDWRLYDEGEGGKDSYIKTTIAGDYVFSFNSNNSEITTLSVQYPQNIILSCDANNWAQTSSNYTSVNGNVYTWNIALPADDLQEFKIIDNSRWYGAATMGGLVIEASDSGTSKTLTANGSNAKIATTVADTYTVTYNSSTHAISVTYPSPAVPAMTGTLSIAAKMAGGENSTPAIGSGTSSDPYIFFIGQNVLFTAMHASAPANDSHMKYAFYQGGVVKQTKASTETTPKQYNHPVGTTAGDDLYEIKVVAYYEYGESEHLVSGSRIQSNTIYYKALKPIATITSNKCDVEKEESYRLSVSFSTEPTTNLNVVADSPYKFFEKTESSNFNFDSPIYGYGPNNYVDDSESSTNTYKYTAFVKDRNGYIWQTDTVAVQVYNPANSIVVRFNTSEVVTTSDGNAWGTGMKVHYWGTDQNGADKDAVSEGDNWYSAVIPLCSDGKVSIQATATTPGENNDMRTANIENVKESGCYIVKVTKDGQDHRLWEKTEDCQLYYAVESTVGTNKYYSNRVHKDGADLSFYANTAGTLNLVRHNNGEGWETIKSLTPSFSKDSVYTSTFVKNTLGIGTMVAYSGAYYLYSPAVAVGKEHKDDKDSTFIHFDGNEAYTANPYNYYWVDWFTADANVSATIGNHINNNLAQAITDEGGFTNSKVPAGGANVRFAYNPKTNYFSRSAIGPAGDLTKRFLMLYDKDGLTTFKRVYDTDGTLIANPTDYDAITSNAATGYYRNAVFNDDGNWVYEIDVKATSTSRVIAHSLFNGNDYYLFGMDGDNPNAVQLHTAEGTLTMRVIYDFKTNRIVAGWVPDDDYNGTIDLNSAVIFLREANNDSKQVKLTGNNKVTNITQVYTVLELRSTNWNTTGGFFWFSLPYSCKIADMFGLGEYGTDWVIQRYRGDLRAQNGWFKETPTFWRNLKKTATLEANRGYVVYLMKSPTFKSDGVARLYFPSEVSKWEFEPKAVTTTLPYNECTICQGCEQDESRKDNKDYDRTKQDSHWYVAGVPAFQNCTISAHSATIKNDNVLNMSGENPLYYYEWNYNSGSPTYTPRSSVGTEFKSTFAYMFQYAGNITWVSSTGISASTPSGIAARRVADEEGVVEEMTLQLTNGEDVFDHTYITLNDIATSDYDLNLDLSKIMNDGPQIYSLVGSYNMAANQLPHSATEVPLGIVFPETGEYQLSLAKGMPAGKSVSIYDSAEDREYSLENPVTIYADSAHTSVGRYSVRIQKKQGQITTAADNTLSGTLTVTQADGRLFISGVEGRAEAMLYDMTGKLLYRTMVESGEGIAAPQQGIYLMRVAGQTLKINVR